MARRDKRDRRVALQQKRADHAIKDFLNGMNILNEVLPDPEPFEVRPPLRPELKAEVEELGHWPEYKPISEVC